jgi:hypothetical protein
MEIEEKVNKFISELGETKEELYLKSTLYCFLGCYSSNRLRVFGENIKAFSQSEVALLNKVLYADHLE